MVLDEKEDRTLDAMAVTPVALVDYMLWRSLLSWALGFGVTLAQMLFVGPTLEQTGTDAAALPGVLPLIGLCALAGLGAPLFLLFLAATASDKVQGFAMAKFIGIGGLLILVGWFLPPLDWLPALFPYLVAKAYWLSLGTGMGRDRRCGSVEPVALAECGRGATTAHRGDRRFDRPPRPTPACLITRGLPTAFLHTHRTIPQPSPKDTGRMPALPR